MRGVTGRAPGKIILIGEHAVVYGHPAIAVPVRSVATEVTAEATRNGGTHIDVPDLAEPGYEMDALRAAEAVTELVQQLLRTFGEESFGIALRVHSDIPMARGMGSSAALCVATIRAVCGLLGRRLSDAELARLALDAERGFHDSPSGIDNSVVALDQPIFFTKRRGPKPIPTCKTHLRFLIADTGIASSTADVVADVRRSREVDRARFDALFWEIGSMASVCREVIRGGSRAELGMCMDRNQELLSAIGVSSPEVDRLVEAAKEAGAAGAKLSGAGRGGNVISLLGDDTDPAALASALDAAGAKQVIASGIDPSA